MKRIDGFTYAETIVGILILSLILSSFLPLLRGSLSKAKNLWQRSQENAQVIRLIHRLEDDLSSIQWQPWELGVKIQSEGNSHYSVQNLSSQKMKYIITTSIGEIRLQHGDRIDRFLLPSLESFSLNKTDNPSTYSLRLKTAQNDIKMILALGSCVIGHEK